MQRKWQVWTMAFAVPLSSPSQWVHLKYDDLPQNDVQYSDKGLHINVNKSVSPLFYVLNKPQIVNSFVVRGQTVGWPEVAGSPRTDYDDKIFRLGFVVPGPKKPNFIERMVMPSWIKEVIKFSPTGGLDKIYFFSLANQQTTHLGLSTRSRLHEEKVISHLKQAGQFEVKYDLENPLETAALWISVDGDDTQSQFQVKFEKILLY